MQSTGIQRAECVRAAGRTHRPLLERGLLVEHRVEMIKFPQLLMLALGLAASAEAATKPHIILSVIDDLGWTDLGFRNNNEIDTPHLDQLARTGS